MANVVLGAGGPTGLECVKRLLAATSDPVRAVVRDPAKYADKFPTDKRLEVVKGDVTDPDSLKAAFQSAKGVIFAASGQGFWTAKPVDNDVRHQQRQQLMQKLSIAALASAQEQPSTRSPCIAGTVGSCTAVVQPLQQLA
jgi:uncharacterized protein YbjT (DUF2867 family)